MNSLKCCRGTFPFSGFWIFHWSKVYGNRNSQGGNSVLVVDIFSTIFLFLFKCFMPFKDPARQHVGSLSLQRSVTNNLDRTWWSFLPPGQPDTNLFPSADSDSERSKGVPAGAGGRCSIPELLGQQDVLSLMRPAKGKWAFSRSPGICSKDW